MRENEGMTIVFKDTLVIAISKLLSTTTQK